MSHLVDVDGVGLDDLLYGGGWFWLRGIGSGVARAANLVCRRRSPSFTMSRCTQTVSRSCAFASHGGKDGMDGVIGGEDEVEGSVIFEGAKVSMVTSSARDR